MAIISGTNGNDTLYGTSGDDILSGGAGNDRLIGGTGADQLDGGDGFDIASYEEAGSAVTINLKTGVHTGEAAGDTFTRIEQITGSIDNDTFVGTAMPMHFYGSHGVDTVDYSTSASAVTVDLIGSKGMGGSDLAGKGAGGDAEGNTYYAIENAVGSAFNDTLLGKANFGILSGGKGDDTYVVGNATVQIVETVNEGVDEVRSSVSYDISKLTNIENLTSITSSNVTLTGNSGDNVITGNVGHDALIGGGGRDTVVGNDGDDTITIGTGGTARGGTGNDTINASGYFYELFGNEDNDTITFDNGTADGGAGRDTLTVTGSGSAYGGEGNDTLTGSGLVYKLYGGEGNDTLNLLNLGDADGGEGSDTYHIRADHTVTIQDTGSQGTDTLVLHRVKDQSDLYMTQLEADLFLRSYANSNSSVVLTGWYDGNATIEKLIFADNSQYQLI